ncbi:MAG: thiamine-monophosphate kinase [Phycisphaerales bacterium JB043]
MSTRETQLLAHIALRATDLPGHVVVGPGDDCALLGDVPGRLLVTTDQVVGGVHYEPGSDVEFIANHALGRALSDIAAMGATPIASSATAVIPEGYTHAGALFNAMHRLALAWECPLVGGDIASHDGAMVLSITMLGREHPARGSVLRSGARVGDGVYVTGILGEAARSGWTTMIETRVREARWLCDTLGENLGAMIDVSDGLGIDCGRIASMSGIAIELRGGAIPCASGTTWREALGAGGDYELCFTSSEEVGSECPETGVAVTRVGEVLAGEGVMVLDPGGERVDVTTQGWDHLI